MPRARLTCGDWGQRVLILLLWVGFASVFTLEGLKGLAAGKHVAGLWTIAGLFVVFSIIWLWSYVNASWGDPGSTETFYREAGLLDDILGGGIPPEFDALPVCIKCHLPKPTRAHHCSYCNQCYFRYDHHCGIIGNCVGLWNMKSFIFIPFYGGIVLFIFALELIIGHHDFAAGGVTLSGLLLVFLALSFLWNIILNVTTVERRAFGMTGDASRRWQNFRELFDGFWGVFLPTKPKISGFAWSGAEVADRIERVVAARKGGASRMNQPLLDGRKHTMG
jgi:hypothetical protein